MSQLSKLPNIGSTLEAQLIEVGICTIDDLKKIGSKQAWLRIKVKDCSACYNRLCALEGAICGIHWHNLPNEVKQDLKNFYRDFK